MAQVTLKAHISGEEKVYRTSFDFPDRSIENPEIERLWAYASIEALQQHMNNYGETDDEKQAITDLALEYGLVTDYTSMIVVRDEVFQSLGIQRNNRGRLAIEHAAQQQRSQTSGVTSRRVDQQQPMYSQSRSSLGGGAVSPWLLMFAVFLVLLHRRKALSVI